MSPSDVRWKRWLVRGVGAPLLFVFLAFNVITFLQARAMTHYAPATARTTRMSELSGWQKAKTVVLGPTIRRQSNTRTPADVGLTFETRTIPFDSSAKLEVWQIPGRAELPIVLMLPGYGASKDTLLAAACEFAALGCELWLLDPRGIGGSDGSVTSVGYHEAEDVAVVFREVRKSRPEQRVLLYGTSMGAVAILRSVHAGLTTPDATILECPFDRFSTTIANRFIRIGLPPYPLAYGVAFWAGVQQGFNGLAHNPASYAPDLRCPTLLLQGDRDESVGPHCVRGVACQLPAQTSRFELIPNAGHAYLVVHSVEAWRASVRSFISDTFKVGRGRLMSGTSAVH